MPEREARLQKLAIMGRATKEALDLADGSDEHLIAVKLEDCLQCIDDRVKSLQDQA